MPPPALQLNHGSLIITCTIIYFNNFSRFSRVYTELINDALTEFSYAASLAGLGYSFSSYDRGIFFGVTGYTEKIPVLSQNVLETMKSLKFDPERFKVVKDDVCSFSPLFGFCSCPHGSDFSLSVQLKEDWTNFYLLEPYRVADYWNEYMFAEAAWTPKERLAELESTSLRPSSFAHANYFFPAITVEDVEAHKNQLLSRVHIGALAHGNLTEAVRNFCEMI